MAERLVFEPETKTVDINRFEKCFPEGKIHKVREEEIPGEVKDSFFFEELVWDKNLTPEAWEARSSNFIIEHDNGDRTYLNSSINDKQHNLHLLEFRKEEKVGRGTITSSSGNPAPHVTWSETLSAYQKQGLGIRRLLLMNALSKTFFNSPLRSGSILDDYQERIWRKLVKQKKTVELAEIKTGRYLFL